MSISVAHYQFIVILTLQKKNNANFVQIPWPTTQISLVVVYCFNQALVTLYHFYIFNLCGQRSQDGTHVTTFHFPVS